MVSRDRSFHAQLRVAACHVLPPLCVAGASFSAARSIRTPEKFCIHVPMRASVAASPVVPSEKPFRVWQQACNDALLSHEGRGRASGEDEPCNSTRPLGHCEMAYKVMKCEGSEDSWYMNYVLLSLRYHNI